MTNRRTLRGIAFFSLAVLSMDQAARAADPAATIERLVSDTKTGQCSKDRTWCLSIAAEDPDAPAVAITDHGRTWTMPLPALPSQGGFDSATYQPWPMRVRFGHSGEYLMGVLTESSTMYSGGGANASTLTLYRVAGAGTARPVFSMAWDGGSMIRACFSEQDYRQRAGACHDEYNFDAAIDLVGADGDNPPVLRYRTEATSFPGAVSRRKDSLDNPRLRRRDLVKVPETKCSFTRLLRFDVAKGHYVPDRPIPECEDYTDL